MKKKLESELISIAHRILKLKNKSDLIQLHLEAQRLYERLSVLRFVEENFGDIKPTIGLAEMEEKLAIAFENEAALEEIPSHVEENIETSPVIEFIAESLNEGLKAAEEEEETLNSETDHSDENSGEEIIADAIVEATDIKIKNVTAATEDLIFKPAFELTFDAAPDPLIEEISNTPSPVVLEDLLGPNYVDPVFVKPEDLDNEIKQSEIEKETELLFSQTITPDFSKKQELEPTSKSINDRVTKGITIGLNDRIGFIKHLFADNAEDYNRVLSQLITFDTLQEVQLFIDDMVKPDYNNWEGKEEYAKRFMEIIEKKFS